MAKEKLFMAKAKSWIIKNKLHGPHAFLRFVMLVFVQRLNEASDEFIFKGGNLLWLYIQTPRSTIDADFVTRTLNDHQAVRNNLEASCNHSDDSIRFQVLSFEAIEKKNNRGASVTIQYNTREGQQNTFGLDIVYAVVSDSTKIISPIEANADIAVVTIENIIADKLSACHQFKSGNTRMKDFDDLWRISKVDGEIVNWTALNEILETRTIEPKVHAKWLNELMKKSWNSHTARNKGLPKDLADVMKEINVWLAHGLKD
ncbi:MAG: nucleotidyl transferase AbiEii/AbiGii toxin family protein [Proteobacteria bacterium]|nr:nucleotidyl transferase AbiEii/AbiGii toxin family protein [Pseudomonadota bacterium]